MDINMQYKVTDRSELSLYNSMPLAFMKMTLIHRDP
jgi:hypothetical protein